MLKKLFAKNKGQTLVIFALAIAGLIAVAALIIDGGGMYVNRRQAQTAADSAAMAGVNELCYNKGTQNSITNVVNNYALTQNQATSVDSVSVDFNGRTVSVATTVSSPSFFAVILGQENNVASAQATAGCFIPGAFKGVLPIAWSCRPTVGQSFGPIDENFCYYHQVPWSIFKTVYTPKSAFQGQNGTILVDGDGVTPASYLVPSDPAKPEYIIYIIIDAATFDHATACKPPIGTNDQGIECDLNGDGISNVYGGANRGWLYLDGDPSPGAAKVKDIIKDGFSSPVYVPQWFEGTNGVSNSIFQEIRDSRVGDLALLPVYTAICDSTRGPEIPTKCPTVYKTGDLISQATSGNSSTFYRVATFVPYVVTCVSTKNAEKCPGKELAGLDHNMSTVEGYFVSGINAGMEIGSGSGLDLGVYIISLTP